MATTLAFAAAFITVLLLLRRWQPVQGFHILDQDEHCDRVGTMGIQILDIRDPIDFESEHHPDAVNIYIGRLPYVSKKELRRDLEIVIVSTSKVHIRRAARILQKEGFTGLSGVVCSSGGPCRTTNHHRQLFKAS